MKAYSQAILFNVLLVTVVILGSITEMELQQSVTYRNTEDDE